MTPNHLSQLEFNLRKDDVDIYFEYRNSYGRWNWTSNNGETIGTRRTVILEKGFSIDRYGDDLGHFAASIGEKIGSRSLSAGTAAEKYRCYEVAKPIPNVDSSVTAPAF